MFKGWKGWLDRPLRDSPIAIAVVLIAVLALAAAERAPARAVIWPRADSDDAEPPAATPYGAPASRPWRNLGWRGDVDRPAAATSPRR